METVTFNRLIHMSISASDFNVYKAAVYENTLLSAHGCAFNSWEEVYNWTFREGLNLRLRNNKPLQSSAVISNMMRWIIAH